MVAFGRTRSKYELFRAVWLTTISVVIPGDIYEARRALFGSKQPAINAEIPESYNVPAFNASTLPNFGVFNPFSQNAENNCSPMSMPNTHPHMPYNLQPLQMPEMVYNNMGNSLYNAHNSPGGYPIHVSPAITPPAFAPAWIIPSPQPAGSQFTFPGVINQNTVIYKQSPIGSWNRKFF